MLYAAANTGLTLGRVRSTLSGAPRLEWHSPYFSATDLGMRRLIQILLLTGLSAPVQADVCSDYRVSIAARDAASRLLAERETEAWDGWGTPEGDAFAKFIKEAHDRFIYAQRAVIANLNDDVAAGTIEALSAIEAVEHKARLELSTWMDVLERPAQMRLFKAFNELSSAIYNARETAISEVCR